MVGSAGVGGWNRHSSSGTGGKTAGWIASVIALCGLSLAVGACGSGDDGDDGGETPGIATIGASGGTVTSADGVAQLTVPAAALASDVTISIVPATDTTGFYDGVAYTLSPEGLEFAVPATLRMTVAAATVGDDSLMLGARRDFADVKMELWGTSETSTGGASVSAQIDHFSVQGLVLCHPGDPAADCLRVSMESDMHTVDIHRDDATYAVEFATNLTQPVAMQWEPGLFDLLDAGETGGPLDLQHALSGEAALYWYRIADSDRATRIAYFGDGSTGSGCTVDVYDFRELVPAAATVQLLRNTTVQLVPTADCLSDVTQPEVSWYEIVSGDGGPGNETLLGTGDEWQQWLDKPYRFHMVVNETSTGSSVSKHEVTFFFDAPVGDFWTTGIGPFSQPIAVGTGIDLGCGDALGMPIFDTHAADIGEIQYQIWEKTAEGQYTFVREAKLSSDTWPATDNMTVNLPAGSYFLRTRTLNPDKSRIVSASSPFPLTFQ